MTVTLQKQLQELKAQAAKQRMQEANKASARELLLSLNVQLSRMVDSVEKVSRK